MKESVVRKDLKESTHDLLMAVSEFPEEYFNAPPADGGWTAGQVAEHLIKTETSTVELFTGSFEISERDPEEKIKTIKGRFEDFESKMKAFGHIIPDESSKDKAQILENIQDSSQRLTSLIELHDLSELITGFAHPLFGHLSRVEWIYFNIYHTYRHVHQIHRISESIPRN